MRCLLAMLFLLGPAAGWTDFTLERSPGLPAYVLQLPASVDSVLIAETDTATLHRFAVTDGRIEEREQRYMSIGQNGVGKQRSGDRRTPLGIYFANEQLDTSRMNEKYGPTAFPLDYPNAWDEAQKRTGDGIWIHGVLPDGGRRPPLDTDGCIALPNDALLELEAHLELLVTPVIITRRIRSVQGAVNSTTRDDLNAALRAWADSYRDGDWYRYLSLYADDFEYRGLDKDKWSTYRVRSGNVHPVHSVTVDDVLLLADPEEEGLFLSRFRQTIVDNNGRTQTVKRIYWRRAEGGALEIVAEDNG